MQIKVAVQRIFLVFLFFILLIFSNIPIAQAVEKEQLIKVEVVVFLRNDCVHCRAEDKFLNDLKQKRTDFYVTSYRLDRPRERKVWEEFTEKQKISKVTPITVIGNKYIIGFNSPEGVGREITSLINETKKKSLVTNIKDTNLQQFSSSTACDEENLSPCVDTPKNSPAINLPIIGRVDTKKYPLFALSAILGFFDGFNPCAMWVLVTFLIILLQVGNRKRMFIFAGTFILAEAMMYTLILTVWFKTWDFVKLDSIVTPVVGATAIAGGLFFLKEWRKKELECKVTNLNARQKTRQQIEKLATNKFTLVTFFAILGVAFSVNVIEFACSIGIPQAFTKILEINQLPSWQNALLILVYIFFYMLDDLAVFGLALYGADKLSLTAKYSRFSNLLGGIVMIILGVILLIQPRLLMF